MKMHTPTPLRKVAPDAYTGPQIKRDRQKWDTWWWQRPEGKSPEPTRAKKLARRMVTHGGNDGGRSQDGII